MVLIVLILLESVLIISYDCSSLLEESILTIKDKIQILQNRMIRLLEIMDSLYLKLIIPKN